VPCIGEQWRKWNDSAKISQKNAGELDGLGWVVWDFFVEKKPVHHGKFNMGPQA